MTMSDEAIITLAELVDLNRYPIDQPDSDGYRDAVAAAQADLGSVSYTHLTLPTIYSV